MKQLSWKPIRRGKLYCAPACGHGCTWKEYESTVRMARRLAKRLGRGWKTRINENMGWFGSVIAKSGCLKVHVSVYLGKKHYTALLGEGETGGRWAEGADTPEKAIKLVHRQASKELSSLKKLVSAIAGVKP